MATGYIKWFNLNKGFGFIALSDGRDAYVSYTDMENWGNGFHVGDRVECEIVEGPKGLKAVKVVQRNSSNGSPINRGVSPTSHRSQPSKVITPPVRKSVQNDRKAEEAYKSALVARDQRRYDQARELFERAIQLSPKRPYFDAYARMERNLRQFDRARGVLRRAIERFPLEGGLYESLGELERTTGNLKQAADIFRLGLQRASRHKALHRCLGQVLMDMNDPALFDEAEKHFQVAREHRLIEDDQRYLKLKVLHAHPRGILAWRFLRAAGFEEAYFWPHRDERYAADMVVKPLSPEYVGAYDLTDEIFVRCFYKETLTYDDIHRALTRLRRVDERQIRRHLNRDVIFTVLATATHLRDALYRLLEEPDQPAVVPLEETEMQQALQTGECESVLRQILDQWLFRRDLYKGNLPVAGRRFFGREVELATLVRNIDGGQHTGVFGLRKVGKTSLLYQLREKRPQDLTAYVDLLRAPAGVKDCTYIYWNVMNQWREELEKKYPLLVESVTFRLGGCYESYAELPPPADVAVAFDADIRALHKALSKTHETTEIKALLLLDELERMLPNAAYPAGWSGYGDFFAYVRGFSQETRFLVSVIAAANPRICEEARLEGQDNPVFRFYDEVYLPPLERHECFEMIEKLGKGMGLSYTPPSLQRIYEETGGHPFITRQLCSRLSSLFPHRPLTVEASHVAKAVEEFLFSDESLNREILSRLEESFPHEKELLLLIARKVSSANELAQHCPDGLEEALRHLVGYQLIIREDGAYHVKIGLLRRWIRRRWLNLED